MSFIYRLGDHEDSVWVTHPREMNEQELRSTLVEHLRPLAEEEATIEAEGIERFGKGAKFAHVKDGKVFGWSDSGAGCERPDIDPTAIEEWQERLAAVQFSFERMLASAGFTMLKPTAAIFCPDRGPTETLERLHAQ